ncbi:MAG: ABC transporter ATP-binding protein, partial [Pirellulales bacterium]
YRTMSDHLQLVEVDSLTKRYGNLAALDGCTFSAPAGQVCGLLGPNGSGKTTLLRLLMGFLRPTAGSATIDGLDCYADRVRVHQLVSYLPGDARLFRNMKGRKVLEFFSQVRPDGDFNRAMQIADRLGLDASRQVAKCSTGMRQKLALAVVLSMNCPLLILDEPTSNLDPTVRGEVLALIREARQADRTVIFSSHVMSEVEQVCDRVIILREGKPVHDQVMSDLRRQHRIHARLTAPLPDIPDDLSDHVVIHSQNNGSVILEAPGQLAPLFDWLAKLRVNEIRIEPLGLCGVYEQYHNSETPSVFDQERTPLSDL